MDPSLELALRVVDYLWLARLEPPLAGQADLTGRATRDAALLRLISELVDHRDGAETRAVQSGPRILKGTRLDFHGNTPEIARSVTALYYERLGTLAELFPEASPDVDNLTHDRAVDLVQSRLIAEPELMLRISLSIRYIPELINQLLEKAEEVIRGRALVRRFRQRRRTLDRTRLAHFFLRRPDWLRWFCNARNIPVPFSFVLKDELEEIRRSRERRRIPPTAPSKPGVAHHRAYEMCLFGVALSGGGIRSATFALGVLQGLADRKLLRFVDYLSTVSGGGYIGSWLVAWIKRWGNVRVVEDALCGNGVPASCPPGLPRPNNDPRSDYVRPVRFLREYSRYLAPDSGLLSADSWTIASTWLRNTALNFLILTLFLAAVLVAPRGAAWLLSQMGRFRTPDVPGFWSLAAFLPAIPLWVACYSIGGNLRSFTEFRSDSAKELRGDSEPIVVTSIVSLVVAGAFLEVGYLWVCNGMSAPSQTIFWQSFFSFVIGAAILTGRSSSRTRNDRVGSWNFWTKTLSLLEAGIAASVGGGSVVLACKFFDHLADDSARGTWIALTLGVPIILTVISIVVVLLIGMLGNDLADEQREWWSRLGAWNLIVMFVWMVVGAICFFAPLWLARLGAAATAGGIAWGGITAAGVRLAYSPSSGRDGGSMGLARRMLLAAAPAVFILGYLALLSFGLYVLLNWLELGVLPDSVAHGLCCTGRPFSFAHIVNYYWALMYPQSWFPLLFSLVLFVLAFLLAMRVDVNEFSMHHFYRNRLVRTFLGASRDRQHRWPNAFTGFDSDDDISLHRFLVARRTEQDAGFIDENDAWTDCQDSYAGPYPIINTALNIMRGADMARQERKAESFIFTPLWSGFDFTRKQTAVPKTSLREYAYRPTRRYAADGIKGASQLGMHIGTTVAISGAAANPNAGFHSSPSLAFLLTLFNVRLGAWLGNPRHDRTWRRSSPRFGLGYLLAEMTARTDVESAYVQLSDGGHFENMGLYELVRRRCRYIIVSDAEEDSDFKLEGIGGAIRKCRADFGVSINLDVTALKPLGEGRFSKAHCAVGSILYPGRGRDGNPECGTILYLKSTLTGDEPVDVVEFRNREPRFPNHSTANQFFDESHFESYRALGHHAVLQVIQGDPTQYVPKEGQANLASAALAGIFEKVKEDWQRAIRTAEGQKS